MENDRPNPSRERLLDCLAFYQDQLHAVDMHLQLTAPAHTRHALLTRQAELQATCKALAELAYPHWVFLESRGETMTNFDKGDPQAL